MTILWSKISQLIFEGKAFLHRSLQMKAREIEKDDLDEELVDNVNGDNSLSALCLVSDENKDPFLNCDFCAFKLQELQGK